MLGRLHLKRRLLFFEACFAVVKDVYAVRWEGRNGKSGYFPAGAMDWRAIHAARPEDRKKVARKTRMLQPLTDNAIRNHLIGKLSIGIYPLLPDETSLDRLVSLVSVSSSENFAQYSFLARSTFL